MHGNKRAPSIRHNRRVNCCGEGHNCVRLRYCVTNVDIGDVGPVSGGLTRRS